MQLVAAAAVTWLAAVAAVDAFGGGEDRFIRKYAMMKVYESCFGADVVREVRQEMRAACAKCASMAHGSPAPAAAQQEARPPPPPPPSSAPTQRPPQRPARLPVAVPAPAVRPQLQAEALEAAAAAMDAAKFQHAILALSKRLGPQTSPQIPQAFGYPSYYPNSPSVGAATAWSPQAAFSSPPGYLAYYQPPTPQFAAYQGGYYTTGPSADMYPQGRAINQRKSRDLDLRGQLETLTSRISGKVKNVTCVMQELGYLDENLEPNYAKITERINQLPINDELKKDMVDGVEYCKQFSQCVPETKRDKLPLSRELAKPMFFFRCYKHKKLEACVMKDVRERYSQNDDMSDVDSMSGGELRSFSSAQEVDRDDYEDMALAMYEFMYGGDGTDFDSVA
ncbi:uncharacterized protein LOC124777023 [Schistocerca piceifrons]|uniref:uncharacterized protein LOC124777023 n=1 Tax=Schistocerca piceifrons TaxID=274613 RepID=UPI001F5E60F4|nr:uncharacterized protein LOC124777023 [Schistocerca piceifrons]